MHGKLTMLLFNSLTFEQRGCNIKLVIFKFISRLHTFNISGENRIGWMAEDLTDDWSALARGIMCLGAIRHQVITWTNIDQTLWRHMAPLGHNESYHFSKLTITCEAYLDFADHEITLLRSFLVLCRTIFSHCLGFMSLNNDTRCMPCCVIELLYYILQLPIQDYIIHDIVNNYYKIVRLALD